MDMPKMSVRGRVPWASWSVAQTTSNGSFWCQGAIALLWAPSEIFPATILRNLILAVCIHLMATGGGSKCWQTNKSSFVVKLNSFFLSFSQLRASNQLFSNRDFEMLLTASHSAANPPVPLYENRNHHLHPPFRRHHPRGSMQHHKGVWAKTMPEAFSIFVQISSIPDA